MKSYTFSIFKSKRDDRATPQSGAWAWWVREAFSKHVLRPPNRPGLVHATKKELDNVKDGPCIVLGPIEQGLSHTKENVRELHALALDLDGLSPEATEAALTKLGDYSYAAWTTYKHGTDIAAGLPRLRIIVPLETPVLAKDYASVWRRFNQMVGNVNDPSTKDINRLHFLPATFDLSLAQVDAHEGRFLHIDELPIESKVTPAVAATEITDEDIADVEVGEMVARARRRIQRAGNEDPALKLLARGDSLAEPGERHKVLLRITHWLAGKDRSLTPEALDEIFGPSLEVMMHEDPEWAGMADIYRMYDGAVQKKLAKAAMTGVEPYTQEELAHIAKMQNCAIDELQKRWIIQNGDHYFFLKSDGYYSDPVSDRSRLLAVQTLARAPVTLSEPSEKGVRRRPIPELAENYGYYCKRVVADLVRLGSVFDPEDDTLHEATCPVREQTMEPVYNEQIAEWLKLLAGDEDHEYFCDWLSTFPRLERPTSALFVKGTPGAGKSVLAQGLARFWTKGSPTSMEAIFSSFNEKLAQCPLVVADEKLTKKLGEDDPTAILRRITSGVEHELSRKFRAITSLHGALRVILSGNNVDLLRGKAHTADDQEAIIVRFLVIEARPVARDYLAELGGWARLNKEWVENDGLAKHVTWLHQQRGEAVLAQGGRFAVAGRETAAHREALSSKFDQLVKEWLVSYCGNPAQADAHPQCKGLVRVGAGKFLISGDAMKHCWQQYLGAQTREEPRPRPLGQALQLISHPNGSRGRVLRKMADGSQCWLYDIDVKHLIEFSNEHAVGSADNVLRVLHRPRAEEAA